MAIRRTKVTSYNGASAITHTFAHESSSYYRGLVVFVNQRSGAVPSSVTYNGVAMTLVQSFNDIFQYVLQNPPLGTYDVIVTFPISRPTYTVANSYANVSQTELVNTFNAEQSSGSQASVPVTPTISDTWAVTMGSDSGDDTIASNALFYVNDARTFNFIGSGDSNGDTLTANIANNVRVQSSTSNYLVSGVVIVIAPIVAIPILETTIISNIALTTALASDEVLYDGDATVTERGFVYNTATLPTTANSKKVTGGTVGEFSATLDGLSVNTTYYVRAYATNANGTAYGTEVSFTTLNIGQYELQKEIAAKDGQTFIGQINVTGTVGTITVKLGSTGTSTVINAGAGNATFSGTYSGTSGLIITRSADFNGTIDNVYYAQVPLGTTVDWNLDSVSIITAIDSSVFFKRIEDDVFNSFRFYRYLDLLFKDLDGFVTVTVRDEREDITTEREKTFSVGNTSSGTVSPFQKKRVSFLVKNQAVIIGLSNGNIGETFSIAQFILTGHKRTPKMFAPNKIQSM